MFVALAIVGTTTVVNSEVNRRLATMPLVTTTSVIPTTTTIAPRPQSRHRSPRTDPVVTPAAVEAPTTTSTTQVMSQEVPQSAYDIINKLDALPVRDEHTVGYARYHYGAWRDEDGNGCTTNYDVLIQQGSGVVHRTSPCDIVSGEWHSLYDDTMVEDPDSIAVDHVVGIYESWKSGAYNWTDEERNDYLNDVKDALAILAVSKTSQGKKAGRDPKDWLPANQAFRCRYLQTWVDIKTQWKMSVDAGEREAIAGAALNC